MAESTGSKRVRRPALPQMKEEYEDIKEIVEATMKTVLEPLMEKSADLRLFAQQLKEESRKFIKQSRLYSTQLYGNASPTEAQAVKEYRDHHIEDVKEMMVFVNTRLISLAEDTESYEIASTTAGMSTSSESKELADETFLTSDQNEAMNNEAPLENSEESTLASNDTEDAQSGASNQTSTSNQILYNSVPVTSTIPSYTHNTETAANAGARQENSSAASLALNNGAPNAVPIVTSVPLTQPAPSFVMPALTSRMSNINIGVSSRKHPPGNFVQPQLNPNLPQQVNFSSFGVKHSAPWDRARLPPSIPWQPTRTAPQQTQDSNARFGTTGSETQMSLQVLSNHLLQQDIVKRSISSFDGSACSFWPWVGKVTSYIEALNLTPLQVLQLMESHCDGEPRKLISNHLASIGFVSTDAVQTVWQKLICRFGSPQRISAELKARLKSFPDIKPPNVGEQLYKLHDLCTVLQFNMEKCPELFIMNYGEGLMRIKPKLPMFIQREWQRRGQAYSVANYGAHPQFSMFVDFIQEQATLAANEDLEAKICSEAPTRRTTRVLQTSTASVIKESCDTYCHVHKNSSHSTVDCRRFENMKYVEKKNIVRANNLCFRCLGDHFAANCQSEETCKKCNRRHHTLLHQTREDSSTGGLPKQPKVLCIKVCKGNQESKSCSKTILVKLTMDGVEDKALTTYAIIDEQSSTTLVDDAVVKYFGRSFPKQEYTMKFATQSCEYSTEGHLVTGLRVRGIFQDETIPLPAALSCRELSDTRHEVATPEVIEAHKEISHLSRFFPEFDSDAQVLLLIGRNCGRAMATECITAKEPYVHRTPLGYALVGDTCINRKRNVNAHVVMRTDVAHAPINVNFNFTSKVSDPNRLDTFATELDDEETGLSQDDKEFLDIMRDEITINSCGNLQLPLPLKCDTLPDNKLAVYMRTKATLSKLKQTPTKIDAAIQSMKNSIEKGYVEEVPPKEINNSKMKWYLPIFPVTHPRKKKLRLVFDAAAKYQGMSLNDALHQGPNMTSDLRGVLLRFRERPIAISADIEAMFNNFHVPDDQRDLLRYFWFKSNNPENEIIPYRSISHLFGCNSSPAVASFALKFCAAQTLPDEYNSARTYLNRAFYVDDGLYSLNTPEEAVRVLSNARAILQKYNIRLHKICSNSQQVMDCFPVTECENSSTSFIASSEVQHALGVAWDTTRDNFVMNTSIPNRPFSKRGILSVINGIYDPLGLLSPIILQGRLIQREILPPKNDKRSELEGYEWDDILPAAYRPEWESWIASLDQLKKLVIPRSFYLPSFSPVRQDVHIFVDASVNAIGFAAYMRSENDEGQVKVALIHGSSRVAPRTATSVPRLELNAAVEGARYVAVLKTELEKRPDNFFMYSDSNIVLGYLNNSRRRFSRYVERRISIILSYTNPQDWTYVKTAENPADLATRPQTPNSLMKSKWFIGPDILHEDNYVPLHSEHLTGKIECLPEEKQSDVILHTTFSSATRVFDSVYRITSNFQKLIGVVRVVLKFARLLEKIRQKRGVLMAPRSTEVSIEEAILTVVKQTQQDRYADAIKTLQTGKPLPESHSLSSLSPFLGVDDVLYVGGRLKRAKIPLLMKHPVLIPKDHPVGFMIASHYHGLCKHQGNHLTHGAIRQAGYHLEDGRQLVRKLLKNCVLCRKLRAPPLSQLMADLPFDRLEETAPFENVGVDVFGPFYIHDGRKTRSTVCTKKIWVTIFVCLPSRAVHLEPLCAMDTVSFRNALTRFCAIRGPCKIIRSDQGSNFISARKQIGAMDPSELAEGLERSNIKWILNPPHASHHGGSWERKIGSVRRVLEASFALASKRGFSRDEFTTLLAEASSIVNNTPLWAVPCHPDEPSPLTPAMLLNMKTSSAMPVKENYTEKDLLSYGKLRHRKVEYIADQFWCRWRGEYLQTLTKRNKWKTAKRCLEVGDIVLLRDKTTARNVWPMGRVSSVKCSQDGLTRSATIRLAPLGAGSKMRQMTRSIGDLVLLIPTREQDC